MVTKGVRKLTLVMVELFFLILLHVQANNLVLASFQSSSCFLIPLKLMKLKECISVVKI
jgi:hypothetical protein